MLNSMTGFGKAENKSTKYIVSVEVKSVNHRFKDFRFRMPSYLSVLEIPMRTLLSEKFTRGSFDIFVSVKSESETGEGVELNENKIAAFIGQFKKLVSGQNYQLVLNPVDFIRSEFSFEQSDEQKDLFKDDVLKTFENCLSTLKESRREEGEKLGRVLVSHLDAFESHYKAIPPLAVEFRKSVEERLRKRFVEFSSELKIEESRFLQEVVYYLDKLDISEELNRIAVHLDNLRKLIRAEGDIGRKVDFFVQELNRESNTIGSKSGVVAISNAVIEMKNQLEKVREQALNIE